VLGRTALESGPAGPSLVPRYRVDTRRSSIGVDLSVNLHPSHLTSNGLRGTLKCELNRQRQPRLDAPYSADLTMPVASLSSGNPLQDVEMRRRLDAGEYPDISARVTRAAKPRTAGTYQATVRFTLHGRTRSTRSVATLTVEERGLVIDAETTINMKDFGIDPPRLFMLRVEPEVKVGVHIVADEERRPPRSLTSGR